MHSPDRFLRGMKAGPAPCPQGARRRSVRERGVALIIVLSFIVLCTILVVAFFASVTTEGAGQRAAASENSAMTLAASAAQLVEGTITMATEPTTDTTFAWASQPGMIRTYGTGSAASSDPLAYYKLYSSNNMIISGKLACNAFTGIGTTSLTSEVPRYWDYAPPVFTDLNAPLLKTTTTGTTSTTTPIFPIVDPRAADLLVEGFSSSATSVTLDGTVATTANPTAATSAAAFAADSGARLPMPVRWLYVLADGTFTAPDQPAVPTATMNTIAKWGATVASANVPSSTNPIVGRVAFWTDDESAKVNVNTASEGTYWDTIIANAGVSPLGGQPISSSAYSASPIPDYTAPIGDDVLALLPPAQHEYQRYPGHPATTCLSTVLGNALGTYNSNTRAQFIKAFTDAAPRVQDLATATSASGASSMGGTQLPQAGGNPASPVSLTTDFDRLYASLDEFQFTPPRAVQTLGASSNATTLQNDVNTCRFFLTAHSKAPELNLFGLPRVAMWPIWSTSSIRTAFEQEMARCATVASGSSNAHQMIFQRANALSPSVDWTGIARNQQVYGYLQALTNRPVPGFGGQFTQQYGQLNTDQILTEIFDYIRCTNLADNSLPANGSNATPYTGYLTNGFGKLGEVVPITITSPPNGDGSTTHGLGRIATIGELALVLIKVDDRVDTTKKESGNVATKVTVTGGANLVAAPATQTLIEWALVPKIVSPMAGYVALANNIRFHFSQINLSIGGQTTTGSPYSDMYDVGRCSNGRDSVMGGVMGVQALTEGGAPADSAYPTGLLLLTGTSGSSINISGNVTVQIYAPDPGSNLTGVTPLQTLQFNFALPTGGAITAPIPALALASQTVTPTLPALPYTVYPWFGTCRAVSTLYTGGANGTFAYPTSNTAKASTREGSADSLIVSGSTDVVRSLVPTGVMGNTPALMGDYRLLAMAQNPPAPASVTPLPSTTFALNYVGFSSSTQDPSGATAGAGALPTVNVYAADSLRASTIIREPGFGWGSLSPLIAATQYDVISGPEVPPQPTGTTGVPFPGDWDNGTGLMPDGPWANKPDEGVVGNTDNRAGTGYDVPYIGSYVSMNVSGQQAQTLFSPNRQISSPVMFGSLPAGWLGPTLGPTGASIPAQPWRTLLFRPATLTSTTAHPGGGAITGATVGTIRDHLLLDLFWMPVVEPYGISEPFATSGKINLNTQIAPFTYITRTTGLRAVLKSVMVTALNPSLNKDTFAAGYKHSYQGAGSDASGVVNTNDVTRYPIDLDHTVGQITTTPYSNPAPADSTNSYPEFARATHTAANPNFFVSASQICDVPLVPQGAVAPTTSQSAVPTALQAFWATNTMTGDNSLEKPYSLIYPRVTTKSNIFTVYVRAQALKKITSDPNQAQWQEGKDQVLSDYRGSFTIEKYFDPNTCDITDASGNPVIASTDGSMPTAAAMRGTKWRLLNVKRFGQ